MMDVWGWSYWIGLCGLIGGCIGLGLCCAGIHNSIGIGIGIGIGIDDIR